MVEIPEQELEFSFSRSSGPGGQNVNKVNSKVTMRWKLHDSSSVTLSIRERFLKRFPNIMNKLDEVVITSDKFRDQARNIEDCKAKLQEMLREVWKAPKVRKATKPTTSARMKRLDSKKVRGQTKKNRGKVNFD
jgi:ribosome-associated protein